VPVFGAKFFAGAWLGLWALVEAYAVLARVAAAVGLTETAASLAAVATIVVSVGAIGVAVRKLWRQGRRVGRAITTVLGLDEKLDEHRDESRKAWERQVQAQEALEERTERLERTMAVYGQQERAAVRGALEAVASPVAPRPARATDPPVRTGWRE
jgi:hypothetical protein